MPEIKIAVDAMGSDQAPAVEVEGAVQAAAEYGIPIVLVGQEDRVRALLITVHPFTSIHTRSLRAGRHGICTRNGQHLCRC